VEADPNGTEWEDLDAEDAEDPMMVSEYVTEIFDYLKVVEVRFLTLACCIFTNEESLVANYPS
jgi:hypothetical protein